MDTASNGTSYGLEVCGTMEFTSVLTSSGQEVTKEQQLGSEIVHVYFVEVGDSVSV